LFIYLFVCLFIYLFTFHPLPLRKELILYSLHNFAVLLYISLPNLQLFLLLLFMD